MFMDIVAKDNRTLYKDYLGREVKRSLSVDLSGCIKIEILQKELKKFRDYRVIQFISVE